MLKDCISVHTDVYAGKNETTTKKETSLNQAQARADCTTGLGAQACENGVLSLEQVLQAIAGAGEGVRSTRKRRVPGQGGVMDWSLLHGVRVEAADRSRVGGIGSADYATLVVWTPTFGAGLREGGTDVAGVVSVAGVLRGEAGESEERNAGQRQRGRETGRKTRNQAVVCLLWRRRSDCNGCREGGSAAEGEGELVRCETMRGFITRRQSRGDTRPLCCLQVVPASQFEHETRKPEPETLNPRPEICEPETQKVEELHWIQVVPSSLPADVARACCERAGRGEEEEEEEEDTWWGKDGVGSLLEATGRLVMAGRGRTSVQKRSKKRCVHTSGCMEWFPTLSAEELRTRTGFHFLWICSHPLCGQAFADVSFLRIHQETCKHGSWKDGRPLPNVRGKLSVQRVDCTRSGQVMSFLYVFYFFSPGNALLVHCLNLGLHTRNSRRLYTRI